MGEIGTLTFDTYRSKDAPRQVQKDPPEFENMNRDHSGIIRKAQTFAQHAHTGQEDDKGLPYYAAHLCQVADLLRQVTDDPEIIAAGYLHDIIEDTDISYEDLKRTFGERVADLVYEVTHEGHKDNYGYYFPRLESRDAILIKFADRLSNLSRMETWDPERKEHYLKKSRFWRTVKKEKNVTVDLTDTLAKIISENDQLLKRLADGPEKNKSNEGST